MINTILLIGIFTYLITVNWNIDKKMDKINDRLDLIELNTSKASA